METLPDAVASGGDGHVPARWRPRRIARITALVVAVGVLAGGAALALTPFEGHATRGGHTESVSCGTPIHERSDKNPVAELFGFLLEQAAGRQSGVSSSERQAPRTSAAAPEQTQFDALSLHYRACQADAAHRFTTGTSLVFVGLAALFAVYVCWPVRREEERERPRRLGYQPALDGLRALSIIAVMLFHAGLHTRFVAAGYLGVGAFFVLSGFLITTLIMDERRRWRRVSLRHFYARRALRLLPLVVVAVAVGIVLHFVLAHGDPARPNGSSLVGTAFYFSNWVAFFHPGSLGILDHTWSLAIEEQFYLVWPTLLVLLFARRVRRGRILALVVALCAASALLRLYVWRQALAWRPSSTTDPGAVGKAVFQHLDQEWNRWYVSSFTRADALLIGCITAIVIATLFTTNVRGRRVLRGLMLIGIVAAGAVYWQTGAPTQAFQSFLPEWGLLLFSAGIAIVIAAVVFEPRGTVARALSVPPMTWVGKRSYGMYVIHWPVVVLLDRHLHFGQWNVAVTVGISVILSALSFRYLEAPALRLKDRFSRSGDVSAPPPVETPAPRAVVAP